MEKKAKDSVETIIKGQNLFEDARGKIINYELTGQVNFIGLITSKKRSVRANHYHPDQEQKCLLISGKYVSVFKDLSLENSLIRHQLIEAGDLSIMPPKIAHTMIFLEDSVFLNLVNGNRNHNEFSEHTIKYELVKHHEIDYYINLYSNK
ncbi:MAG: hypothetical protein AABY06_01335 [Nanoarchaeota archaeon]